MPAVVQPDVSSTMQFPVAGTSRDVYRCGVRWGMGAALVLTGRGRVAMHQPLRRGHRRLARSDAASGVAASADASASPAHDSDNGVTTEVAMDTLGPASRDAADSDAKGAQQVTRPAKVRSGGASAAAPEPSHAAQTITDCAPQGLDSLALRDTATRADPFIPGTMTASQQVAVAVQVGTILFTGGLWVWLYTTHGNSAPLVNAQMGALLANSSGSCLRCHVAARVHVDGNSASHHCLPVCRSTLPPLADTVTVTDRRGARVSRNDVRWWRVVARCRH